MPEFVGSSVPQTGAIFIIVLCAALLFAVGIFLCGVGKIIYGIARYKLYERPQKRRFSDPDLGVLTSDNDLWSIRYKRGGKEFLIVVAGTGSAPEERLLRQTKYLLAELTALEDCAAAFLRAQEPELREAPLLLYMLAVTDEHHLTNFTLEFESTFDDRVWRVEFVSGEPKESAFDH